MPRVILAILLVIVIAGSTADGVTAATNIPDPALSIVPSGVLLVPNNPPLAALSPQVSAIGYSVTVNGNLGPVAGAMVELTLTAQANSLISWCNGADGAPTSPHPVMTATTNASGVATFRISGGGCILPNQIQPYAAEIRANSVTLASDLAVVSFDAVNSSGQTTAVSGRANCEPTPPPSGPNRTTVGLSDAVFHTGPFSTSVYQRCSDFNSDNAVTTADAVLATQFIVDGLACTCDP